MRAYQVFGYVSVLSMLFGLLVGIGGNPDKAGFLGVPFWLGLIGYFVFKPSKEKIKEEKLEERLRELELQNKIADAEERVANRSRDA